MTKLAKREEQHLAEIPAYLRHDGPARGTEDVTRDDLVLPRLALCQSNTPQRKKAELSYIEGLDEGQFFNTVTGEVYGTEITAIPLFFFKQRMYFAPLSEGGGILCQSQNGVDGGRLHPSDCATCPHAQFKNEGDDARPDCQTLMNFMLVTQKQELLVFSLKSTGIKAARQLNAQVRMSGLDMFARTLTITAVSQTRNNNQFWAPSPKLGEFVPRELYESAGKLFSDLRGKSINLDTKGLDDEPGRSDISDKDVPF